MPIRHRIQLESMRQPVKSKAKPWGLTLGTRHSGMKAEVSVDALIDIK